MTIRYVCVRCGGEKCPRCVGRGWVGEGLVRLERHNKLAEVVAKHLVQKRSQGGAGRRERLKRI